MAISPFLYVVGVAAVAGGYWYMKQGKFGSLSNGDYYKNKLQLQPGETPSHYFTGAYYVEKGTGQKVAEAALGVVERGEQVLVCPTNLNRLIIGHPESTKADPTSFEKGGLESIETTDKKPQVGKRAGMKGIEKAVVVEIRSKQGGKIVLELTESAVETLQEWLKN